MLDQKENDIESLLKAKTLKDHSLIKTVIKELYSRNTIGEMEIIESEVLAKMFPIDSMFLVSGAYYSEFKTYDYEMPVKIIDNDDGILYASDSEGNEFLVDPEELSKI